MTEQSRHWDGITVGDSTMAPYSASEWADQERLEHGQGSVFTNYGVISGSGGGTYPPLQVNAKSPASTNIEVEIGCALVHGYLYENTAALTFTVGANASGNARIDTVILRVDFVAQTIRAVVKQGTPAASPARPTLQQDTSFWEIPLADIAVANGFSTISDANITPRQRAIQSSSYGWLPHAYPLNHVVNNAFSTGVNLASSPNTSIAVPFYLPANMLLQDIVFRVALAFSGTLQYGIYFQDVNDGNTSENTLRLIASGSNVVGAAGAGNVVLTLTRPVQFLHPGLYWFVLRNASSSLLTMGGVAASSLDTTGYLRNQVLANIPQTLDMVTNWSAQTDKIGLIFRGRVFGMTTNLW